MIRIEGECQSWCKAGSNNLKKQLPHIVGDFPEINGCHYGTINLYLDNSLIVISPDHRTKPVPWDPAFGVGEVFDFLRIEIEAPVGSSRVKAWLYIPHGSPHRKDIRKHEIITTKLKVIEGNRCAIIINKQVEELPYMKGCYFVV
jgi:hypothetical protein